MSEELKQEVVSKVLQYLNIEKLETNKFEFKRDWYDLKDSVQKNEFFKDTTAIVNSYGGDDGFIVFGVDDKTKELFDVNFEKSGYKDQSSIRDIVDSNIDKPFRFDIDYVIVKEKRLCVLHLQPSTDKPHVILRYKDKNERVFENEIFLRSGSAKVVASKGDLDRMYVERNSIVVERKAEVSINLNKFKSTLNAFDDGTSSLTTTRTVLIENLGMRVLPVYRIILEFDMKDSRITFVYETYSEKPIVIDSNKTYQGDLKFIARGRFDPIATNKLGLLVNELLGNPKHQGVTCNLVLANGEYLRPNLFMPNINQREELKLMMLR